jgi:hypothetical protein
MFFDSLEVYGILEKKIVNGVTGYKFVHETMRDYYRHQKITMDTYKESRFYESIVDDIANHDHIVSNKENEHKTELLAESTLAKDRAIAYTQQLLDALFFDNYDNIVEVVLTIALDNENNEISQTLSSYLYSNHEKIFEYLSNKAAAKYPGAPRAHRCSYYA